MAANKLNLTENDNFDDTVKFGKFDYLEGISELANFDLIA